jgi:hypothetical protein
MVKFTTHVLTDAQYGTNVIVDARRFTSTLGKKLFFGHISCFVSELYLGNVKGEQLSCPLVNTG